MVLMKPAGEEIDGVVGSDRLVQESNIPKLPFLQAIVKETFRRRAPTPLGVPHKTTAPEESHKISSGTRIMCNMYAKFIYTSPFHQYMPSSKQLVFYLQFSFFFGN